MSKYGAWKNHIHQTNRGGVVRTYSMPYLWEKAKNLPVSEMEPTDVPEFEFLMDCDAAAIWGKRPDVGRAFEFKMSDFRHHAKRVMEADLEYPVILNPEGGMMDGIHRLMKALILGEKVKVVQFDEWPEPNLNHNRHPLHDFA